MKLKTTEQHEVTISAAELTKKLGIDGSNVCIHTANVGGWLDIEEACPLTIRYTKEISNGDDQEVTQQVSKDK